MKTHYSFRNPRLVGSSIAHECLSAGSSDSEIGLSKIANQPNPNIQAYTMPIEEENL